MMRIEEVRIDSIEYHKKNPKQHPDKQIRLIQESIKKFGWTNPVILSADGVILAGHARVKAAIEAGNDTVPCIRTKLSGKDADAYLIADNRLSDLAPYDRDILAELLSDLPKDLADITGFEQVQIDALLSGEDIPDIDRFISDSQPEEPREEVDAEPQIDRAAELNEKWKVKSGDLWELGLHRLVCGDCTDPAVVERVMMGEKADLVLTDPPYGMGLDASWYGGKTAFGTVVNSPTQHTGKAEWDESPFDPSHLIGLSKNIALFGANFFCTRLPEDGTWWVWDKHITADGETPTWYGMPFELIWMNGKHAHKVIRHLWAGFTRKASNEDKVRYHPTQKPIAVMSELIEYLSGIENIVLDPYLGSGTTMIACENTGRKCRGIEISPDYCAVVLQRFKDATGKEPVRIND